MASAGDGAARHAHPGVNARSVGLPRTLMHQRYLWARRPAIADGGVHHVQAVSSRVTPSPPSRCWAGRRAVAATRFTTASETQRPYPHGGPEVDRNQAEYPLSAQMFGD